MLFIGRVPQRFVQALAFLSDIQERHAPDWVGHRSYSIQSEEVLIDPPALRARIYRPLGKGRTAGVLLIPGLHPQGVNDPRFDLLARAIVRQGFTVLGPDIVDFRRFQVTEACIGEIICAAKFMIERMADVDTDKVGIFGVSYSAGPVLIAASHEELADKIAFVVSLGGYYDLLNPIEYVLTGNYDMDGKHLTLQPHPWARMIFALNNLDLIASDGDTPKLQEALGCRLRLDEAGAKEWEARLSGEGRELLSLVLGPANPELHARMSPALARLARAAGSLSPAVALTPDTLRRMRARIYLLHGANDDVIPCSETWRLAEALRQRGHPAERVLISKGITHVDPAGKNLPWHEKLIEGFRLITFMMALIGES
jgi:dienelactone hydrolase